MPTNKEWREIQISTRSQIPPEKRPGMSSSHDSSQHPGTDADGKSGGVQEIDGVKYGVDEFLGVKVLLPV